MRRILVVEDSAATRSFVRSALEDGGHLGQCDIVEATSGFDALRLLPRGPYDLVITDINMPRMNGIEMLTFLKQDPRHANLLVLMLTTEGQPALIARAKAAGARGWIVKPFKPDLLLGTVRKLVGSA